MEDQREIVESPATDGARGRLGRRGLIAGGLGALLATAFGKVKAAEAQTDGPKPLLLAQRNVADGPTQVTFSGPAPTIEIDNDDSGPAFLGHGVIGVDPTLASQVSITERMTFGVAGVTGAGGRLPGVGVFGTTDAMLPTKTVVTQTCAIRGSADGADEVGVSAENADPSGIGLKVLGRIAVSCAGTAEIPQGESLRFVKDLNIKADSLVLVTLTGTTGSRSSVFSHTDVTDGGAIFHLTKKAKVTTPFNYFCFEKV